MRFELSLAFKYLLPRAKQLSVSIISLISILVVALVVWLVVVFLSVTQGIEKKWLDELIAINAPLRILPKEEYYKSYYYQIDSLASSTNYSSKSLGEKLLGSGDPYDPTFDAELPQTLPTAIKNEDGSLKELAQEAFDAIASLKNYKGVRGGEFEISYGNLELEVAEEGEEKGIKTIINQLSYVSSFDQENHRLKKLILPPSDEEKVALQDLLIDPEKKFPEKNVKGEPILVAKTFRTNGVHLGDVGTLSYYTEGGAHASKEQHLTVYVAGFYDPGLMPIGNKVIFGSPTLLAILRGELAFADKMLGNGFSVWFQDLDETENIKNDLIHELKRRGVDNFFTVESYADYEMTKPVLDQLKSDKTLFTLIALIILVVACSNIISMLILLVNDKKKEIGILQSMGVTRKRVGFVFGLCGFLTGLLGSIAGILLALFTLHNLNHLVSFLSFLQGREAFQAVFYGEGGLPSEVSPEVLLFVFIATVLISLLAGLIPAIKAAKIRPAVILRSE